MAVSGTVPSRRPAPAFEPVRAARWLRRASGVAAVVAAVLFFRWFGAERVPAGMDSVPSIAPGSWVILDRRTGSARVGSHVFVDVPGGGTVLSRVAAIGDDGLEVLHPNAASTLPDSRSFGRLPLTALRSTVLVVFGPEPGGSRGGR